MSDSDDDAIVLPIDGTLDLHAFAPRDVADVVADYIAAATECGLTHIRLIHGRGKGVQRAVVHRVLAAHPMVLDFHDASDSHLGATVAHLRPSTDPSGVTQS